MRWPHRHRGPVVQAKHAQYARTKEPVTLTVLRCARCGKLGRGEMVPGHWSVAELNEPWKPV